MIFLIFFWIDYSSLLLKILVEHLNHLLHILVVK
jgi:hypothetical protein